MIDSRCLECRSRWDGGTGGRGDGGDGGRYAVMTAAYVPEKLGQFLIGLGTGGASGIRPLPAGGLVAVATTEAWDGQDAPQEDDDGDADDSFSLEDLAL